MPGRNETKKDKLWRQAWKMATRFTKLIQFDPSKRRAKIYAYARVLEGLIPLCIKAIQYEKFSKLVQAHNDEWDPEKKQSLMNQIFAFDCDAPPKISSDELQAHLVMIYNEAPEGMDDLASDYEAFYYKFVLPAEQEKGRAPQ